MTLETMASQARRALEHLRPENLHFRFTASWALALAHLFAGDRAAAARACRECVEIAERSGQVFSRILAAQALGNVQELNNQLQQAAESYRRALQLAGEHPLPNAEEMHLGLARIYYQWNDLDAAEQHGQQSRQLARLYDRAIDRSIATDTFLARVALARGDVEGAAAMLAQAQRVACEMNFALRLPEIAAVQVVTLIRQGQVAAAAQLAGQYELPLCQATRAHRSGRPDRRPGRVGTIRPARWKLGVGRTSGSRQWFCRRSAQHQLGESDRAARSLDEALALAEPGGFVRLFVDEGAPMAELLSAAAAQGIRPEYVGRLLAAFAGGAEGCDHRHRSSYPVLRLPPRLLSPRELEVLRLIAQGLSNQEIGKQLFLALDTVKGHNRRIFEKLHVQRRTEAVARARELGLL